jgi:hypothetical protein
MRFYKVLAVSVFLFLFLSCGKSNVQPIEKYRNKGIIVLNWESNIFRNYDRDVRVKTKDSIFEIQLTKFDMENIKVGDTL